MKGNHICEETPEVVAEVVKNAYKCIFIILHCTKQNTDKINKIKLKLHLKT